MTRLHLLGRVVSNKMTKSIVVAVERAQSHPKYGKVVRTTKNFMAHDEQNACQMGDIVEIEECRPLSKNKHFIVKGVVLPNPEIQ